MTEKKDLYDYWNDIYGLCYDLEAISIAISHISDALDNDKALRFLSEQIQEKADKIEECSDILYKGVTQ